MNRPTIVIGVIATIAICLQNGPAPLAVGWGLIHGAGPVALLALVPLAGMRSSILPALLALMLLACSSDVWAQAAQPSPPNPTMAPITFERAGIAAGASAGYGVVGLRDTGPVRQKSGAFTAWLGWCFADRVLAGAEVESVGPWDNGFDHRLIMATVQYWPARRVWVRGGLGIGSLGIIDDYNPRAVEIDRGPAYSATLGIEIARFGRLRPWTADMQVRFAQSNLKAVGWRPHNVSIQVGVAWYTLRPRK